MNDELILHHYDGSPFSEKVRLMLGFKGLAWRSVKVPVILPKPDVVALTGGYRKTPFVQVGADVYCDTALIARLLEARAPTPRLFPPHLPLAPQFAQWADSTMFWTAAPYTLQPAGAAHRFAGAPPEVVKAFVADRAAMTTGMTRQTVADATVNLRAQLAALEAQLVGGGPYLFGDVSIADFSVAHCVWFVASGGPVVGEILFGPGLFAARYSLKGPRANPEVAINPLSALAPGVLRNIFGIFEGGAPPAAQGPPAGSEGR